MYFAFMVFVYVIWALTLAVFIYGVTSWYVIKKFRHFKNYVYLNVIVSSFLRLTAYVTYILPVITLKRSVFRIVNDEKTDIYKVFYYLKTYFTSVQYYWLLVICFIFYVEIVKVFSGDIRRRYLKSTLLAWGVPLITTLIIIIANPLLYDFYDVESYVKYLHIKIAIRVLPLFVNLVIYIILVISLFRASKESGGTAAKKWRHFYIATLIFVLSDVVQLSTFIWDIVYLSYDIQVYLVNLQTIAIDLFFPIVKSNRELWRTFFANRLERNMPL